MKRIFYPIFLFLLTTTMACKDDKPKEPETDNVTSTDQLDEEKSIEQRIAEAHGISKWDKVEQVNFTFKVTDSTGTLASRSWEWIVRKDEVTLVQPEGNNISYTREENLAPEMEETDKKFINDIYWLLPYFKLVWDDGVEIAQETNQEQRTVIASYGDEGGYTPGDKYVIHYRPDFHFETWEYYPSGSREPRMVTTFEDYRSYGEIKVAHLHRVAGSDLRILFTDVDFKFSD